MHFYEERAMEATPSYEELDQKVRDLEQEVITKADGGGTSGK